MFRLTRVPVPPATTTFCSDSIELTIPIRRRQTMEDVAVLAAQVALKAGPDVSLRLTRAGLRPARWPASLVIPRLMALAAAAIVMVSRPAPTAGVVVGALSIALVTATTAAGLALRPVWTGPGLGVRSFRDSRNPPTPPSSGTRLCREPGVTRSRLGDPLGLRLGAPGPGRTRRGRDHDAGRGGRATR